MVLPAMVRLADVDVCLNIALLLVRFNGASAITDGATDSAPGDPLGHQNVLISEANHDYYRAACPDYRHYAAFPQYVRPCSIAHLCLTWYFLLRAIVAHTVKVLWAFHSKGHLNTAARSLHPW